MRLLAGDKVKSMFDKEVLIPEATRSVRRSLKRGRQVQEVQDFGKVLVWMQRLVGSRRKDGRCCVGA